MINIRFYNGHSLFLLSRLWIGFALRQFLFTILLQVYSFSNTVKYCIDQSLSPRGACGPSLLLRYSIMEIKGTKSDSFVILLS